MWFKNRRAKCRQQMQQQHSQQPQNKASTSRSSSAPAKAKPSKSSPANVSQTAGPSSLPSTPAAAVSPPVIVNIKKESPQIVTFRGNGGNLTPIGSNASSAITTPSPPITPSGSNPSVAYQHESYNSFNWHSNGHNSSPHYYGQNYNPAYYTTQMDYFSNQQGGQNQMQMGNHMGGTYQMSGYAGMGMATPHHQNFTPRHPDCNLDYMNQMV